MKKLICVLMVLTMVLSFAACGNGKVTIYIPDTVTIYDGTGALYASVAYHFEEGWQDKETFTCTQTGDEAFIGGAGDMVYSDKKMVQEGDSGDGVELHYDDQGNEIVMINYHSVGSRYETFYTYDSLGRQICEEEKYYETADAEPECTTVTYTYVETEEGSVSTQEMDGYTMVVTYDKNGWKISEVMSMDGVELTRTETTYDAVGNVDTNKTYYEGQLQMEVKYTWTAVEVSNEVAARLPQYRKGN
jgi:hypothetical protein